jgi:hypothetical protein
MKLRRGDSREQQVQQKELSEGALWEMEQVYRLMPLSLP